MEYIRGEQLSKRFENLCERYRHYEWAVAWASKNALWKTLWKRRSRIEKLVVGLHFYQTSPEFIERYLHESKVRYIKKADGVFHPKVYLFYNDEAEWAVVLGSSNFTQGGFEGNEEVNILITNEDADRRFFRQIQKDIEGWWMKAHTMAENELENYKTSYKVQKCRREQLARSVNDKSGKIVNAPFVLMNWAEYVNELQNGKLYDARMKLLADAGRLFKEKKSFGNFTREERKNCAIGGGEWDTFGHMVMGETYRKVVEEKDKRLVQAIDGIPFYNQVSKKDYELYIKRFRDVTGMKNPLFSATRLLAMKRPDVFVCVNGGNIEKLREGFGFRKSGLTVDTYWDLLIERIHEATWFKEKAYVEKDLKEFQVAMLDGIAVWWKE